MTCVGHWGFNLKSTEKINGISSALCPHTVWTIKVLFFCNHSNYYSHMLNIWFTLKRLYSVLNMFFGHDCIPSPFALSMWKTHFLTQISSKLWAQNLILFLHVRHSMPVRKSCLGRHRLWPNHCSFRMAASGCSEDAPRNPMHRNHPEKSTDDDLVCKALLLWFLFARTRHRAQFCSELSNAPV